MSGKIDRADVQNDLAKKMGDAHDLLVKSAKLASIAGAICGFIYLLSYTTHVGIPFPLELSVLPTTLLIVGLTSITGTFIVMAGMFIPALTLEYNDEVTKGYRKANDLQADVVRARFSRYFFCTWVPTALALTGLMLVLGVIGGEGWPKVVGWMSILISTGWVFYTPKYVGVFLENRWQYLFINSLQILLSVFAYLMIIFISIAIFPELGEWQGLSVCLIALIVFTLFQIVIFVPSTNNGVRRILLPPKFETEATPVMAIVFGVAAFLTALTVIMPQLNYKIGGAALRAFHVGGDVPVAICLKTKPATAVTQQISFDGEYCSEKLSMKLDSGDRVYVSKYVAKKAEDPKKQKSQPHSIYFRQDEIKQKIYFPPPESKSTS